jgi:hypothetical protein
MFKLYIKYRTCIWEYNTMKVIKIEKNRKHLNTLEKYHIYKTSKDGLQMNDTYLDTHNLIFEVIQDLNNR